MTIFLQFAKFKDFIPVGNLMIHHKVLQQIHLKKIMSLNILIVILLKKWFDGGILEYNEQYDDLNHGLCNCA